jgi:hypothetical protein
MFNRIYSVAFSHLLGIFLFCIIMKSIDMLLGSTMINFLFETTKGVWALNGVGVLSVSLAVWDGQFVRMVKKNHWSQREKKPTQSE